jgi:hypothetical protein
VQTTVLKLMDCRMIGTAPGRSTGYDHPVTTPFEISLKSATPREALTGPHESLLMNSVGMVTH